MTTISRKNKLISVGELSKVFSQIVLKSLYVAGIGRPNILWSVNKLARAVTKWTRSCDKRLARLISYIHCTSDFKQYCHVGNTAKQCGLGLFQDSDFGGDMEDSTSASVGTLHFWQSYTSPSSTESEISSLDAGFRMDGIPAIDLWDLVIDVLHFPTTGARGNPWHNKPNKLHVTQDDSELVNVDYVSA